MPTLAIDIEARLASFQDALDKIGRQGEGVAKRIDSAFGAVRSSLAALGVGLSAGAFASFVKSGIDAADSLGKMSQRIGVTVESLSALEYAASLSDVSIEQLQTGLARLARAASDAASGSKEQAEAFTAIGVAVKDAQGNLRGTEDLLLDLAERFSDMEDSAGKTALAMRLFGRAGAELIPYLNLGRTGIEELRKEAERLGIIISTDTSKAAETFNDNMTRLGKAVDAAKYSLAEQLLPALTRITEEFINARREGEGFFASIGRTIGRIALGGSDVEIAQESLRKFAVQLRDVDRQIAAAGTDSRREWFVKQREKLLADIESAKALIRVQTDPGAITGEGPKPEGTKRTAPSLPSATTGADAGQQFVETLRRRLTAIQENEFAVLRLEAAQKGVATAAEPLILQLQRETEFRKELTEAQARDKAAAEAEIARRQGLVNGVADYVKSLQQETALLGLSNEARSVQVQLLKLEEAGLARTSAEFQAAADAIREAVGENAGAKLFQETRTEMEKARAEIERIRDLFIDGFIDEDTMKRAIEKLAEGMRKAGDEAKKTKSIGEELGLTFSSAFERAVLAGDKLRDVLKGIVKDIAAMVLRNSVTKPAVEAIDKALGNIKLPGFATGGSFMVGGSGGTDSQLVAFRATPGERVSIETPGQQRGGNSYNVYVDASNSNGINIQMVRREVELGMRQAIGMSVNAVLATADRGGAPARQLGRR
jgi:ribosomal protein L12E/L44/L45/RPP1/RPP2